MADPPKEVLERKFSGEKLERKSSSGEKLERKSSGEKLERKSSGEKLERKSSRELPKREPGEKPHLPVCYLCKREFGSQSIPIHIKQCQRKWLQEQEKLPEHERRPLPQPPYDEEPIKTGGPPQEDNFSSEARSATEASLTQCPHCQRQFVPRALQHHSGFCTEANPGKPAGSGLTPMSLTNRLVPGEIAGSQHGKASEKPPKITKKIGLFTNWKLLEKQRSGDLSPGLKDHSQGQCSESSDACDSCGTCDRPDSNFCSLCGKKRSGAQLSPSSPKNPKAEPQDVVIAWVGKSPNSTKEGKPPVEAIAMTNQDKVIVDCSNSPVEIVIQVKPTSATPNRTAS